MRYEYAYRERPITYVEWKGDNFEEVHNHTRKRATLNEDNKTITIPGIRSTYTAYPGDYIIWDQTKHGGICYPVPWALFEIMFGESRRY
jgi:hypothetical protein